VRTGQDQTSDTNTRHDEGTAKRKLRPRTVGRKSKKERRLSITDHRSATPTAVGSYGGGSGIRTHDPRLMNPTGNRQKALQDNELRSGDEPLTATVTVTIDDPQNALSETARNDLIGLVRRLLTLSPETRAALLMLLEAQPPQAPPNVTEQEKRR